MANHGVVQLVAVEIGTMWRLRYDPHMTQKISLAGHPILPDDGTEGTLVGRVWRPAHGAWPAGPSVVAIRERDVFDISRTIPTIADLLTHANPAEVVAYATGDLIGSLEEIVANTVADQPPPEFATRPAPVH